VGVFDLLDFCLSSLYCRTTPLKTEIHLSYITKTDQFKIFRAISGAHSENHKKRTNKNMTSQ
jgi:hypothetical protein